ncbi:hypothetical protein SUGI_0931790 [Cryptomeria japonica]|nr:hypothetical protein SUGI_0931790 [Cryptomeria japonica]
MGHYIRGLPIKIPMMLKDARSTLTSHATLGASYDTISQGPIYFDCALDFTVSLKDGKLDDVLNYKFKSIDLEMKTISVDHTLTFLIHYWLFHKVIPYMINPRRAMSPDEAYTV